MRALVPSSPPADEAPYRCPQSGRALHRYGSSLRTDDGAQSYPVVDGIPNFLKYQSAIEEASVGEQRHLIDEQKLDHLIALSREMSCLDALRQTYGADSDVLRYVTRTAPFFDVVPLRATDTVLEIGSGLGQFTLQLARRVTHVSALEVVAQQARFTQCRCEEAGLANVDVACGGDDCRLPYADASFDAVIMNLVFEWCASRVTGEQHPVAQRRYLREALRVLKPGGYLYLATKNRYSLHYLLGRRDEHAYRLPFGNALPRALLALALRLTGRTRAAGCLYSTRELRRMVLDSGFADVSAYCPVPDPRHPDRVIPADPKSIAAARGGVPLASGRVTRPLMRLMPARLASHLTYGQIVLARRPV